MRVIAEPLVKDAAHTVTCTCGYAADSNADTPEAAIADVATRSKHKCEGGVFSAEPYACDDCNTPLRIHQRIIVGFAGHNIALCKRCVVRWAKEKL